MGSPPQVRGKLVNYQVKYPATRITPAGAGKTAQSRCTMQVERDHPRRCGENHNQGNRQGWDHPRRCGENLAAIAEVLGCRGSPPQVRGKPPDFLLIFQNLGITPAGAGKTQSGFMTQDEVRDHPRRCGENRETEAESLQPTGSPPQVRGKLPVILPLTFGGRITPAGAGKTGISKGVCPKA